MRTLAVALLLVPAGCALQPATHVAQQAPVSAANTPTPASSTTQASSPATPINGIVTTPTPSAIEAGTPTNASNIATCAGFNAQYIGSGITTALPGLATRTTYAGTADPGPIQATAGVEFAIGSDLVAVGRNVGATGPDGANIAARIDGSVTVWVRSNDPDLRRCVLDGTTYDRARDQQDSG